MPTTHLLRRSAITPSFRVDQVCGLFDVPNKTEIVHEWTVAIPCEEKIWQIGAIVGASGSGKTTIGRDCFTDAHFHEGFAWDARAILDNFPDGLTIKDITHMLSSVGLSSPPDWLKPFAHLSNGQKFRVELARLLLSEHPRVIFDEFTSVVDREVAKVCCAALAKTIRRRLRPQLVVLSCHFDILDWLQPDWLYEVSSGTFEWRSLRRRPDVRLTIHPTDRAAWRFFRGHHYLSADLHNAARCFVACWQNRPVAFVASIYQPHALVKNLRREHRCVVLPDYQGLGIGNAVSEWCAAHYIAQGFRYTSVTSHPSMISHRAKSKLWRLLRAPSHACQRGVSARQRVSSARLTCSFEYIGAAAQKSA